MEKALADRLDKVRKERAFNLFTPDELLRVSIYTLEALRAHIQELHPATIGDILSLEEALEVVKDYR